MKCCVIFAIVILAVLAAETSAAPPRPRQLLQRRSQRVFLVPKYALRRSWQETPDITPSSEEVILADDSQLGVIDVSPQEDPTITESEAPSAAIEEFAPESAAPNDESVVEEESPAEEAVVPATKSSKRPAQSWPHTFFPMNFGRSSGGSIAVANSFTTGKGNAVSHSVALGSGKHNQ